MKGITACVECANYDMKSHKCTRGCTIDPDKAKGDDVRFYADCPLQDAEPVRHGLWKVGYHEFGTSWHCSECYFIVDTQRNYCACCGAKMDGR